jgi:glycine/D-amino acid oxidase-like deaminating enzyme
MAPRLAAAALASALLLALALPSAVSAGAASAASAEALDVCVVGAGPSGVAAALALSQRGKSVALLEREDGVGGQAYPSYQDPASGFRVHMGAVVLTPPDYPIVMGFAKQFGIGVQARTDQTALLRLAAAVPLTQLPPLTCAHRSAVRHEPDGQHVLERRLGAAELHRAAWRCQGGARPRGRVPQVR